MNRVYKLTEEQKNLVVSDKVKVSNTNLTGRVVEVIGNVCKVYFSKNNTTALYFQGHLTKC